MPVIAIRSDPRISVNKLGEYMVANASRRRRIVQEQKHPPDFQVARYTEAQEAIAAFLASGASNEAIITTAITRLDSSSPRSDWDAQRIGLCIEALQSFLHFGDYNFLGTMRGEPGHPDPAKLNIAGVRVSVRPEVILRGSDRSGSPIVGAVKLYLGKSLPLEEEAAAYVGTTVHQFVNQMVAGSTLAPFQRCVVVDVFAQKVLVAPRSFARRRRDIEAACEEIGRAWPVV